MVLFCVSAHQAKQGMAGAGQEQGRGWGKGWGKGPGRARGGARAKAEARGRAKHNMKPQRTSQICANHPKNCASPIGSNRIHSSNSSYILAPVAPKHLLFIYIKVTFAPTFQNLTNVDTSICKHKSGIFRNTNRNEFSAHLPEPDQCRHQHQQT